MREIKKFRVWDKRRNKMLDYDNDICPCITLNGVCQGKNHTNVSFDYVLLQFTGLKDKNEKEIYEGDIVKYTEYHKPYIVKHPVTSDTMGGGSGTPVERVGEVRWTKKLNYGSFTLAAKDKLEEGFHFREQCEIIGNIYENPELLK